jgi:hypothetical protein
MGGEIYQLVERVLVVFIRLVRGTFQPDQAVARIPLLAEEPFPQYHAELEHCRRFTEGGSFFVPGHGALRVLADTGAEFAADCWTGQNIPAVSREGAYQPFDTPMVRGSV